MTEHLYSVLNELVPRFDNDPGDWERVLRDTGRSKARLPERRITRRRLALVLVVTSVIAAILVGSALALHRGSIDFWNASPAPERIVVDFAKMRALAVPGLGPNVIPGEARRITSFDIDGKPEALFVAPTEDGGYCWRLHFVGSCGRTGRVEPRFSYGYLASEQGGAAWISGHFVDPEIARLELEYEDGSSATVPFVWVTEPIDAGFFSFDVPSGHLPAGHRPTVLRAFDEDGNVVARREFPFDDPRWEDGPDGLPRIADRTHKQTIFDFHDHRGTRWTLVVAPAPGEKLCYAYNFGGGCLSPKFPATIGGMRVGGGNVVSVCCAVAEGVSKVVLRYQDGHQTEVQPVDEFLLYVIPPERYAPGRRLTQIAWLNAEGHEIASRSVDADQPGIYPCAKEDEIERGAGVTTCP